MRIVNIHYAKTHLSKLLEEAARGEPFIIAKAGKPMVRVVALEQPTEDTSRRFGFLAGRIQVPDDFDTMGQAEILEMFGLDEP